jgi:HlyD family secretion protein
MNAQRILIAGLVLAAIIIGAVLLLAPRFNATPMLSGYVEGEPLYPAAPVSGRIVEMKVKRGDVVKAGEPLFAVDPSQTEAQKQQSEAAAATAEALATDARQGARPAELGVIEANLAAAHAQLADAQKTLARVQPLAQAGAASRQNLDQATAARDTAAAQVKAIEKQLAVAKQAQRQNQIAAADSRVREAEAGVAATDARLADLAPKSPAAGRIEDVFFQPGEWAPANQPVLSLIPDSRVRIRFFAPEKQLSAYKVGAEVSFTCDGCAAMKAKINYVSPRPEFTPPTIYAREARDRMVFLIEAEPIGGQRLSPGQPIDVTPLGPDG